MNREILFRGKRKYVDEFINGSLFIDSEENHYIIKKEIVDNNDDTLERLDVWSVIPSTVGQYTGLEDSDGNKIFEGDVVEFYGRIRDYAIGVVVFEQGEFRFRIDKYMYKDVCGWKDTKIIGNIHDNPELMKGE